MPLRRAAGRVRPLALLVAVLACAATPRFEAALPPPPAVDAARVAADVAWLADPAREGRGLGTRGLDETAAYVARAFAEAGLLPADADGDALQVFEAPVAIEVTEARLALAGRRLRPGRDFEVLLSSASGELPRDVVFAGYGISDPASGWDDYAGLDVEGRTVLVLDDRPGVEEEALGGIRGAGFARPAYKLLNARRHGAAAVLLAPSADATPGLPGVGGPHAANPTVRESGLVALSISRGAAKRLARAGGLDLVEAQAAIDASGAPASLPLEPVALDGRVRVERRTGEVANVVGLVPGGDPELRDEVVVVGAHFDHLGHGEFGSLAPDRRGEVHPGADDNASGTAALLALARAFGDAPPPRRTVVLAGFTAEEAGLLGSAHYTDSPPLPLSNTVAMLNLDMVGRLDDDGQLVVFGTETAKGLRPLVRAAARDLDVQTEFTAGAFAPSDQTSFAAEGVPVLFLFTGPHPEYHTPDDVAATVDAQGVARVAALAYRVARALADADARPRFVEVEGGHGGGGPPPGGEPGYGPYLGTVPAFGGPPAPGVRLSGVREGSPAEGAGLRPGDVIVDFDGTPVRSLEEFAALLFTATPGRTVEIVVLRDGERVTTRATLGQRR